MKKACVNLRIDQAEAVGWPILTNLVPNALKLKSKRIDVDEVQVLTIPAAI